MKGIIAEINKKYAIVLTQDGSFKKIRTGPGMAVGAEIDLDQPSGRVKAVRLAAKVSSIAAAALFILGLGYGTYSYTVPYSYVDIDINPSVELTANIFDKIIKAEALDDDGEALLSSGGLKNTELKAGVSILLNEAARQGYLNTEASGENTVLLTVTSKDEGKSLKLKEEVKEAVVSELQKNEIKSEVLVAEASIQQKNEAKKYGMTPGRLVLIEEAADDEAGKSLDELKDATVRELVDKASKKKVEKEEKEKAEKEKAEKEKAAKEKEEKEEDKKAVGNGGKSAEDSSAGNTGNSGNAGKVLEGFGQWKAVPNVGWIQGFAWPYGYGSSGYGGTGNGTAGYGSTEKDGRSGTGREDNAGKSAGNSYNSRYSNKSEKDNNKDNNKDSSNNKNSSKWSNQDKNNDVKNKNDTGANTGGKNGSQNNSGTGRGSKGNERLMDELLKGRERVSDELLKGKERLGNMLSGSEKKDQGKSDNQSVKNSIGMWRNPPGNWNIKDQDTKSGVGSKKNYSTTKKRK